MAACKPSQAMQQRCCCQASPSEQLLSLSSTKRNTEFTPEHVSVSSPPRLKYILITYHHSAGYQQGYWDSLFVLEGGDSWGNEDRMQEAINYFSIILKPLWWQLLQNQSFLFFFSFSPPLFHKAADSLWQNLNSVNTKIHYQYTFNIKIQYQNTLPKSLPQHKALILTVAWDPKLLETGDCTGLLSLSLGCLHLQEKCPNTPSVHSPPAGLTSAGAVSSCYCHYKSICKIKVF